MNTRCKEHLEENCPLCFVKSTKTVWNFPIKGLEDKSDYDDIKEERDKYKYALELIANTDCSDNKKRYCCLFNDIATKAIKGE